MTYSKSEMAHCSRCDKNKHEKHFSKDNAKKTGHSPTCKDCMKQIWIEKYSTGQKVGRPRGATSSEIHKIMAEIKRGLSDHRRIIFGDAADEVL